jgi:hypothetical protein
MLCGVKRAYHIRAAENTLSGCMVSCSESGETGRDHFPKEGGLSYLYRSRRGVSKEPRNMAIYLLRNLRGDNLEEIGLEFNINRFSSVSSVVERMRVKISENRKLRKRVEELKLSTHMSQE